MNYVRNLARTVLAAAALLSFLGTGPASSATLIGDTVTVDYLFPDTSTLVGCCGFPVNITGQVGNGERVTDSFIATPLFGVDLETDSIIVDFLQNGTFFAPPVAFDGLRISNINDLIIGVIVAGIDASRVTFGNHEVFINFQNLSGFNAGDIVSVTLQSAVPIPAALPLLAGGLGLMGWMARRKRRNQMAEGLTAA